MPENPNSLELEREDELRIFSLFYNNRTRKYRLAHADSVFVDNVKNNCTFPEAISEIAKIGKSVGEKFTKEEIII